MGTLWRRVCAAALVCGLTVGGSVDATAATARTWYVRAAAGAGGNGSAQMPFDTLEAAERAAGPGDTVEVLPSPASTPPLGGGITLEAGQKLTGSGPSVIGLSASAPAPRIENTSAAQNSGDAVVLADGTEVSNIAIVGADLGGIYGKDVTGVSIHGNNVTGTNSSCTTGFVVQPFNLPTSAPGVGAPFATGLSNGWAAIMVDESHTTTTVSIDDNFVHDGTCADGIDVRASGTAHVTALVDGNTLTRLRQDPRKSSELAIGMQAIGTSRLTAEADGNSESYIGTATVGDEGDSDSEGVFENTAGPADLVEHVDHNTFAHGLGHLSANCVEMAASNGQPTEEMTLTNSTCDTVVGDIIEAANLSNGTLRLDIDHVVASHSTYLGAQAQAPAEPGDDGDCLLEVTSGSGSTTDVNIDNSEFTQCVADGLGVVSNDVNGGAPIKSVSFEVENSRITDNQLSNLRVESATAVEQLDGKVEDTDLSQSAGTPVVLENPYDVTGGRTDIDLGGGGLGSTGGNCIYGGTQVGSAYTVNYDLTAKQDWWGSAGGPATGATLAVGGTIADDPVLTHDTCGPASAPGTAPSLGCPRATGRLSGTRLGLVTLGMTRARVRRRYAHSSDRGKRFEDFFCLTPIGVRVGYASPKLLRTLAPAERRQLAGRVVWASTSNPYYALRGVRPGMTVGAARKHLVLVAPFRIGLNLWYLAPNGSSTAVLKVRDRIIEEVGIANGKLTRGRKRQRTFLTSFS